jgi:hypothetical protein
MWFGSSGSGGVGLPKVPAPKAPVTETVRAFHGTTSASARKILKTGFRPGPDGTVFLAEDFATARFFGVQAALEDGAGSAVVLKFELPRGTGVKFERTPIGEARGALTPDIPYSSGHELLLSGDKIVEFNRLVLSGQIKVTAHRVSLHGPE